MGFDMGSMTELILVVDDDPTLRQGLQEILEFSGYTVLTAPSAREGLKILSEVEVKPGLIITDMLMMGMDGFQFYQAVYADHALRGIPFIFLSTKNALGKDAERFNLQANFVGKPFAVDDLLSTVKNLISN
jgi:CheY-like chemotaxis protein